MTLLAFIVFWLLIGNQLSTEISVSIFGFVNLPIVFVAYELAVEQTKLTGLGSALPCGVINMLANFVSLVVVLILTPILAVQSNKSSLAVMAVLTGT